MFRDLNNKNFMIFAASNYNSPHFIEKEFFSDLRKLKYIKSLLVKYKTQGDLKERLILNHIIQLYNVFNTEACNRIIFFKMGEEHYSPIKTFLLYLNYMPIIVEGVNGKDIKSSDIDLDIIIIEALKKL